MKKIKLITNKGAWTSESVMKDLTWKYHLTGEDLIEINHAPSFATDSPLDALIKKNVIRDTL